MRFIRTCLVCYLLGITVVELRIKICFLFSRGNLVRQQLFRRSCKIGRIRPSCQNYRLELKCKLQNLRAAFFRDCSLVINKQSNFKAQKNIKEVTKPKKFNSIVFLFTRVEECKVNLQN